MSNSQKQYLSAKSEVESSMESARSLRDQWLAATGGNPTNLTKKEIDYIGKAFKNRLLTAKWDCEDLEELVKDNETDLGGDLQGARQYIEDCRAEISSLMNQLEDIESTNKLFNKHGITFPNSTQASITSMIQNQGSKYERLTNNDAEEVQFDKNQVVAASASIFNNVLYDHFEADDDERQLKKSSNVFNNLSRPITNVYMNPNANEIVLDVLEPEYFNPPTGLQLGSRINYTIGKLFETDRNKVLTTIAFLFSFPIFIILIMVF